MHASRVLLSGAVAIAMAMPLIVRSGTHGAGGPAVSSTVQAWRTPPLPGQWADFASADVSPDARTLVNWVATSRDNGSSDFIVVDKKSATLYVLGADAQLKAASPVLLGIAIGDDSAPGVGDRPLSELLHEERTTPAGRFVAERGHNMRGEDVVWVDYDAGVSMHRVLTTNRKERRLERLATPSPDDNRISSGCINVPAAFYEAHIRPMFATRRALVYVLPEVRALQQVFGSTGVAPGQNPTSATLP